MATFPTFLAGWEKELKLLSDSRVEAETGGGGWWKGAATATPEALFPKAGVSLSLPVTCPRGHGQDATVRTRLSCPEPSSLAVCAEETPARCRVLGPELAWLLTKGTLGQRPMTSCSLWVSTADLEPWQALSSQGAPSSRSRSGLLPPVDCQPCGPNAPGTYSTWDTIC